MALDKQYFLIIGNTRTGSTYLGTTLGCLPDVYFDYEIAPILKLPKIKNRNRIHKYLNEIENLRDLYNPFTKDYRVIGSKIMFASVRYKNTGGVFKRIDELIDDDIKVIHLHRCYSEIMMSQLTPIGASSLPSGRIYKGLEYRKFFNSEKPLNELKRNLVVESTGYKITSRLEQMYSHDLKIHELKRGRENNFMTIDYKDIPEKIYDIARFIGSNATDDEIKYNFNNPITKKIITIPYEEIFIDYNNVRNICKNKDNERMKILNE